MESSEDANLLRRNNEQTENESGHQVKKGKERYNEKQTDLSSRLLASANNLLSSFSKDRSFSNYGAQSKQRDHMNLGDSSGSRLHDEMLSSVVGHRSGPEASVRSSANAGQLSEAAFADFTNGPMLSMNRDYSLSSSTIQAQEAVDGDEVLAVLSSTEDPFEDLVLTSLDMEPPAQLISRITLLKLQDILSTSSGTSWDSLLNFKPDFMTQSELEPYSRQSGHAAELLTGTPNVEAAEKLWLQQWSEVLSSYTEQVWGELEPLVVEAKTEATELANKPGFLNAEQSYARSLDRLRQILAHVKDGMDS